jgi:hypothetical protein
MANKSGRRHFGNVRKLPSGRWQPAIWVRWDQPHAQHTFDRERRPQVADAHRVGHLEGGVVAPEAGEVLLSDYGTLWIAERRLAPRTRQGYEYLFRLHIAPHLGPLALGSIKPATIRTWRKALARRGAPPSRRL